MKTITIGNQKGGVGKSAVSSQLAFYFSQKLSLRVLVMDLDGQGNSSRTVGAFAGSQTSKTTAYDVLLNGKAPSERGSLVVVAGDSRLNNLERTGRTSHVQFWNHLNQVIRELDDAFDVCIMDTNPSLDCRLIGALLVAGYTLSPVQLNQEAMDGVKGYYETVLQIQQQNEGLQFLGLYPNLVEPTKFQKENLKQLTTVYGKLLLRNEAGLPCFLKTTTAIAEAQSKSCPVWKLLGDNHRVKSSAQECCRQLLPAFARIAQLMNVKNGEQDVGSGN